MNVQLDEYRNGTFLETVPGSGMLESERDALDLVGSCGEYQVYRLLINAENIPDTFYDLRSGLAGSVLLKFSNYRIKAAALVNSVLAEQGKFHEFAIETNRGNEFGVFNQREDALMWLFRD